MVSNKKRLYIALYPSGVTDNEERRYHWGFLVGPKTENELEPRGPRPRYHVKKSPVTGWVYEEVPLRNVRATVQLLARILIAKITDEDRLVKIMRTTPVVQDDPNWRCRTWIVGVLRRIELDGKAVGTAQLDWTRIEPFAREYVEGKRSSGRYGGGKDMTLPKPTWDLLKDKEVVA